MRISQRLTLLHSQPLFHSVQAILAQLQEAGFEAYLAGGCVRDALMGKVPKDFDIATSAVPAEVEKLFPKTLSVGKEFGVIVVITEQGSFEVASFRFDGPYIDGRRPSSITFTSAEEDAKRRDFTVNALFYDPQKGEVIDFVGGIHDLNARVLRTVGRAEDRFREDKLRMLRAVRFAAQTGFTIEKETFSAIEKAASEIQIVSSERIYQEMTKLLTSSSWVRGLELLKSSRLSQFVWPELALQHPHQLRALGVPLNWEQSFAAVSLLDNAELSHVEKRLNAWKAPKNSLRKIQEILRSAKQLASPQSTRAERMKILGGENFAEVLSLVRLQLIQAGQRPSQIEEWIQEFLEITGEKAQLPSPFVNGDDLLKIGFKAEKSLGDILKQLYDEQLEGRLLTKSAALERAKFLRQA